MRRNARPLSALVLVSAVIGFTAGTARAQDDEEPTPWDQGSVSLSLVVSTQDSFGDDYFVAGAGAGYYVLPGLELGGSAVRWFGGDPGITQVSPHVRYVAVPLGWPLLPYVGAFYTHFFIEDAPPDEDTVGARLGLLWHQGTGLVFGVGAAFERFVSDCNDDCSTVYPEVTVGFSF
jgi:hypothetical protein